MPRIVEVAPDAVIVAVTDPPDPLADLARSLAGHDRVLSTGTVIDTLRFRTHVAAQLDVHPSAVEGLVVGEHGTSQVMLWSSVRVAGRAARATRCTSAPWTSRSTSCASRSSARSATRTSRSSRATTPASSASASCARGSPRRCCATSASCSRSPPTTRTHDVTIALPTVVGRDGPGGMLVPSMSDDERAGFERSAATLRDAVASVSMSGDPFAFARANAFQRAMRRLAASGPGSWVFARVLHHVDRPRVPAHAAGARPSRASSPACRS